MISSRIIEPVNWLGRVSRTDRAVWAQVEVPVDGSTFVNHTREWLQSVAQNTDASFPENEYMRIERGQPIITKTKKETGSQSINWFQAAIAQRLEPLTIMDVLYSTQQWPAWDKCFGLFSGFDPKINDPAKHYIATTFCYGCNLGPIQAARSITDISR